MAGFAARVTGDLQSIIAELISGWPVGDVYIPGSGAQTIERLARQLPGVRLHSADASMLPAAAGCYLAGLPFRAAVQPEYRDTLDYVVPHLGDVEPAEQLAALMVASKVAPALAKDNLYYRRQVAGYRLQWPELLAKALAKVKTVDLKLDSFLIGGPVELLNITPPDAGVITHVGMWKIDRGAEDTLYRVFDWDRPEQLADLSKKGAKAEQLARVMSRDYWILVLNESAEDLAPQLVAQVQGSTRGMISYVYTGAAKTPRLVTPHQTIAPILAPRLATGQELSGPLGLTLVTSAQFNAVRSSYLSANIRPGAAPLALVVSVGGTLIGGVAFDFDPNLCMLGNDVLQEPIAYLLSDFAVGPTDYPRLSRLVVMAMLSTEAKLLIERYDGQRRRSMVTTAFAKNPSSMKYRGLLDLLTRNAVEGSADLPDGKGYKLTYGGALGRWSLAEALAEWTAKSGERKAAA